jgi:hypothetical protein
MNQMLNMTELKNQIKLVSSSDPTHLIVVAVHPTSTKNQIHEIHVKHGVPVGGYVYDTVNDAYIVRCVDYLHLGVINASVKMEIADAGNFVSQLPLPQSVIFELLNDKQIDDLNLFKSTFKDCNFRFLQYVA